MKKAPATKRPTQRKPTPVHTQERPYFNPLPTPPEHLRPAPLLFVWGTGNFGQFGMGADFLGEYDKPTRNKWIEKKMEEGNLGGPGAGLEAVAAGGLHSLFLDEKGTVWSCGVNDDAALGRITVDVPNPEKEGEFLDVDELTAVPYPLQSLVEENFRAVRITAGDTISAAISSQGDLRVWGSFRGNEGVLGFSSGLRHQFLPASILNLKSRPGNIEKFSSVVAGNNHLIVLTTHGNIYTFGAGEQGQLGRKVMERRKIHGTVPEKIVLGSRSHKAVVVGAGSYSSYAVDEQGTVWAWGLNNMGQTGTGFTSASADGEVQLPKQVIGLGKGELGGEATVVQIVGGEHHTLFLTSDGRVYACGRSEGGQLGLADDDEAFKDRPFPDMLAEPTKITFSDANDPVVHISVGVHNNLAVTRGGALYAWGNGPSGELGVSGEEQARTPTVVVRKEGGAWAAITASCGGQHSLALFRKKT
ncbi:regulator of chromosome condensation 1/beta-lactamase-inhibitor protein II [Rhodofomes roseus]|uniref:Regulator of chromosome condensation 1/beta-lactamase-inhibitor protein II n=1 Tax=Rhodofomes roseus TaxID=34475 RepID=A0ABQ8KWZ6_9APHY|nr:regulator of chromosome condensation 1/beta-lactamase-inhibitor protein II [Rhodofomes roseus]KAH9843822.1 regulator of chromosome condensation 1/beta-lactamase-inhibitor protein II [Rhodofomes roseus]